MRNMELISFIFEHYEEIDLEVQDVRGGIDYEKVGGNGHAFISSPTENTAIRNLMEVPSVRIEYGPACCGRRPFVIVRHPEKWLDVIDLTYNAFEDDIIGKLLEEKYNNGKTRKEICQKLKIGTTLYHAMLNEAFNFAHGVAAGKGLVVFRR